MVYNIYGYMYIVYSNQLHINLTKSVKHKLNRVTEVKFLGATNKAYFIDTLKVLKYNIPVSLFELFKSSPRESRCQYSLSLTCT